MDEETVAARDGSTVSHHLDNYRQRDLTTSHLYRLGTKIFGSEPPTRHRVIDASLYQPPQYTPHRTNLRRTWDGKPLVTPRKPLLVRRHSEQSLVNVRTADFTEDQYRQWLEERKRIRAGLDGMAVSERWLCSKTRTPLENNVLAEIRSKRRKASAHDQIPTTKSEGDVSSSSSVRNPRNDALQARLRERKEKIKETTALTLCLSHGKQRFVTLLTIKDPTGENTISAKDLLSVLKKMRPPVSQEALEFILKCLPRTKERKLDYLPLINGSILQHVEEYFSTTGDAGSAAGVGESNESITSHASTEGEAPDADPSSQGMQSTMGGERGRLSTAYKEEEIKQFEELMEFCKENNILLDEKFMERVLLLPPDHPRQDCLDSLRQPGLRDLLPKNFSEPQEEVAKVTKTVDIHETFGGAYRELRWKRKPKPKATKMPSTSTTAVTKPEHQKVKLKPQLDCWLTFKEYKKWTVRIRSRPDFHYKYHGLPDNNAFWPGALLDRLRLWMPQETLRDKPCSRYNVFQPVTHPKIYNPHPPIVEQKRAWPENQQGYVQFGGQSRKSYAL